MGIEIHGPKERLVVNINRNCKEANNRWNTEVNGQNWETMTIGFTEDPICYKVLTLEIWMKTWLLSSLPFLQQNEVTFSQLKNDFCSEDKYP